MNKTSVLYGELQYPNGITISIYTGFTTVDMTAPCAWVRRSGLPRLRRFTGKHMDDLLANYHTEKVKNIIAVEGVI